MEKVSFDVPKMYADHHVQKVREVLAQLTGLEDMYASSALKRVLVTFDPSVISAGKIGEALEQAGYGPGDCIECEPPPLRKEDGSFWHTLRPRVTETDRLDIEMSGDFRKY